MFIGSVRKILRKGLKIGLNIIKYLRDVGKILSKFFSISYF